MLLQFAQHFVKKLFTKHFCFSCLLENAILNKYLYYINHFVRIFFGVQMFKCANLLNKFVEMYSQTWPTSSIHNITGIYINEFLVIILETIRKYIYF